jgi:hypothetical protein
MLKIYSPATYIDTLENPISCGPHSPGATCLPNQSAELVTVYYRDMFGPHSSQRIGLGYLVGEKINSTSFRASLGTPFFKEFLFSQGKLVYFSLRK